MFFLIGNRRKSKIGFKIIYDLLFMIINIIYDN